MARFAAPFCLLLLLSFPTLGDTMRVCTSESGEITYQQDPCPAGSRSRLLATPAEIPGSASLRVVSDGAQFSLNDLTQFLATKRTALLVWFLLPPALTLLLGIGRHRSQPLPHWQAWLYSAFVYAVTLPGMLAVALLLYGLLFSGQNLLQLDLFVHFLPVLSMIVTLMLLTRQIKLRNLPGFGSILGLMVLFGSLFLILLILARMRIWIGFFGPIGSLLVVGLAVFLAIRWALRRIGA